MFLIVGGIQGRIPTSTCAWRPYETGFHSIVARLPFRLLSRAEEDLLERLPSAEIVATVWIFLFIATMMLALVLAQIRPHEQLWLRLGISCFAAAFALVLWLSPPDGSSIKILIDLFAEKLSK